MRLGTDDILLAWETGSVQRDEFARRWNYYRGSQDILLKTGERHDGKAYNKLPVNWIDVLVGRHMGFLMGFPIQLTLPADIENDEGLEQYEKLREDQKLDVLDSELFRDSMIFGQGVELHAYDGEQAQIRRYDPREWMFVEDEDGNDVAAIRRYLLPRGSVHEGKLLESDLTLWAVYTDEAIETYQEGDDAGRGTDTNIANQTLYSRRQQVGELKQTSSQQNPFGVLPVFRWGLDDEHHPLLTDSLIALQDTYNSIVSAHVDDVETDIDAILLLQGIAPDELTRVDPITGKTKLQELRELGALAFPDAESGAEFLTRSLPIEKIDYTLRLLRRLIHVKGCAPDFDDIVGATGATSGIALKLQFQSMVEKASTWRRYLELAIRARLDRLNALWSAKRLPTLEEYSVKITQNLPVNEVEIWQNIMALEPILSKVDLARLVPSIENPEAAIEAKEEEQQAAGLSSLSMNPVGATAGTNGAKAVTARRAAEQAESNEDILNMTAEQLEADLVTALLDTGEPIPPDRLQLIIDKLLNEAAR